MGITHDKNHTRHSAQLFPQMQAKSPRMECRQFRLFALTLKRLCCNFAIFKRFNTSSQPKETDGEKSHRKRVNRA